MRVEGGRVERARLRFFNCVLEGVEMEVICDERPGGFRVV